jgi:Uma2 family endonuclease
MTSMVMLEPSRWGDKALPGQDELPCEDGEPMETGFHDAQDALLKDTLIEAWHERKDFFVAGNMFVYFSERQVKHNDFRGPDVFVVLDVEAKGRKSWVAWEEGGKLPNVVIEVSSESTRHVDRGEKMRIYAQVWRTPAYFIFDPDTERLEGFRLDPASRQYVPLEPDERGDLPVDPLGLKLGLRPTRYRQYEQRFVRWIDQTGLPLPTASERAEQERQRAEQERQRAEQERQRADRERERARELEERLRQLEAKARN